MVFFYVAVRIYHGYFHMCGFFSVFGESCSNIFPPEAQQKTKELTSKNSCQGYILCTKPVSKIPVKVFQTAVAVVAETWLTYGLF